MYQAALQIHSALLCTMYRHCSATLHIASALTTLTDYLPLVIFLL